MSSLNIYYQSNFLGAVVREDFRKKLSQSDFDIVCITGSALLSKHEADTEAVDTDMFDIFGLYTEYNEKNYFISGTFIAVRKHLSAYARREWMTEGVECVWITVPPRGCRSSLHVACVYYLFKKKIDPFTDTLTSLSKTHTNDKFLVVGELPLFVGDCTSLAGLGQFNNFKDKSFHLVFSSVPVTVTRCPRPLAPEKHYWEIALQFGLDIGPPECCKVTNGTTEGNCRNAPSSQHEAHQGDIATSGDVSEFIAELVQNKWEGVTKLLSELIGEKLEQTVKELGTVRKKCDRISKKNVSLHMRIKQVEDDLKKFAHIEERLDTLEGQAFAHRERGFGFERNSTAYSGTSLFGAAPHPSMGQFGQQTAALQTTEMFGSAGGMFGSATTQPMPAFGAMSSGTNTFGFGSATTQAPDVGLLSTMVTTCGLGPPQTMSSSSASGGVVRPATDFFSTQLSSTNATAKFGTTKPAPKDPNPLTKMPLEPHPTGIKLTRPGYYTIPSLDNLIGYIREDGSCVVPHFTIGRRGYGSVRYTCEMDVAGLNLDDTVRFLNKEVVVYPEEGEKPAVGEGLNRAALVTLDRIWPRDKTTKQSITDPERLAAMDYESTLRRVCFKHGMAHIEYRPPTGSWVFKVTHFSKYGLSDYHEEEDALGACGAGVGATKPEDVGAEALKPGEGTASEAAVKKELCDGPEDIEAWHSAATGTHQTTPASTIDPPASSKPNKTRISLTSALNSTTTDNIPVSSVTSNVSVEFQLLRPGVLIGPTPGLTFNKTSLSESVKPAKDGETISTAKAFPARMTYSKPIGTSFLLHSTSNSTARESTAITSRLDPSCVNMTTNNISTTTDTSNVHVIVNILETMATTDINGTTRNRKMSVNTYEQNPGSNEITTAVNTTLDHHTANKETTYRNDTILDQATNIDTNIGQIAAYDIDGEISEDTYEENPGSNEITTAVNTILDPYTANKETTYRNDTILDQATNIDTNIGQIAAYDIDGEISEDTYEENPGSNEITTAVNTILDPYTANKETTYRNDTILDQATNIDTNIGQIAAYDIDGEISEDTYEENPGSNEITTAVNTILDPYTANKETTYRNDTILDQATNIDTNIGKIAAYDIDGEISEDTYEENPGSNEITTAVNTILDPYTANNENTYRNDHILDRATNIDTYIGHIVAHDAVTTINWNGGHSTPIHGNTTETINKSEGISDSTTTIDTAEGSTTSDIAATSDVHRRTTDT